MKGVFVEDLTSTVVWGPSMHPPLVVISEVYPKLL